MREKKEMEKSDTTACDGKTLKILKESDSAFHYDWVWDDNFVKRLDLAVVLSQKNTQVVFNPVYSTGTAVIRGDKPLEKERHHFWEIQMITELYGTAVMVGVGTAKAVTVQTSGFYSLVGQDCESWGLSYTGFLHHDGKICKYGPPFGQNDLIGIHLDTWTGTLQFFLNRNPLGIAFTKLNNVTLYPLISSTIADCKMKLSYSISIPVSLQSACLRVLTPLQKKILWKKFPTLRHFCQFADMLQRSSACNICLSVFWCPIDHALKYE